MANPIFTGAILIETNGAALNNAGQDEGTRTENAVVVKQIRVGRLRYPYISGQAWRRWWREVLYADCNWRRSPVTAPSTKQAYTAGNPVEYEEDDLFGYMVARKSSTGSREPDGAQKEEGGTYRRISPLKNSLLISVLPNVIESDFGHFTRNLPPDATPIIYESEHYTTFLQGAFTLSLRDVGRFEVGEMRDIPQSFAEQHNQQGVYDQQKGIYSLHKQERVKRVKDTIRAIGNLRGGARLARNLSDVTPVVVLAGFLNGGNAPFQKLFEPDENNERILLNLRRLESVLHDYAEQMIIPSNEAKPLFFGCRPGVLANEEKVIQELTESELFQRYIHIAGTPIDVLRQCESLVEAVFDQIE